jgi:methylmalonyl-CoA mutase
MRIEEAAARRQALIDSGREPIIGVNRYRQLEETVIENREVDNTAVRDEQVQRLEQLKRDRDSATVEKALDEIFECAKSGNGNLLEKCVTAAEARATLGEITSAMERVFGRHKAVIQTVSGVYSSEYGVFDKIKEIRLKCDSFEKNHGRRPRIMIAKMGQDGHDRGAKVVATAYADLGFDVDMGPLFQTPGETARQAVENDVHIIAMSSLAGGHKTLLPSLVEELTKHGREDIVVIAGGVIPKQDYTFLKENGAAFIFGPGTVITDSAEKIIDYINNVLS